MSHTITHFMWGYQAHFRIRQMSRAKSLFRAIDDRFDPEVFLVGVRLTDKDDRYPACVEPENDFWIKSEAFNDVLQQSKRIIPTYPESNLMHSHPQAQKWHVEGLLKRAIKDGIAEVIAKCITKPYGMCYFISWPVNLDVFLVSLVVGLQRHVIESHPCLNIDRLELHECRSYSVPISFLQSVMDEYLDDIANQLLTPDAGVDITIEKSPDEIRRAAGTRMMFASARKTDTWDNQLGSEDLLFDACNRIAALKYERAPSKGRLILAKRDHPSLKTHIAFRNPIEVQNGRAARKLLELSSGKIAIHMNSKDIWGIVELENYQGNTEDLFEINVLDHHIWELAHAGKSLMYVRDGMPSLPKPPIDYGKMRTDLFRVFTGISDTNVELLVSLVDSAVQETHGTILLISNNASSEAARLRSQATCIEPSLLTPDLLMHLTPIDGAVLLEPNGICHAIGVILDGLASEEGNSARGARFNSAVRYVATQKGNCFAIICSEDGGVDLVPNLRPPIRRSAIETRLTELDQMVKQGHVLRPRYLKIMEWFRENSFYLLYDHCERLNTLAQEIENLLRIEDPEVVKIYWGEFISQDGFD